MKFKYLHPRDEIIEIINRIYQNGMTTTSGGNLSILDEDGSICITPKGVDKGSLIPKDIVRVLPNGTVDGIHEPSSGGVVTLEDSPPCVWKRKGGIEFMGLDFSSPFSFNLELMSSK